jgi:hypothetical protein
MVVPEENGAIDLPIERHRDFLVAFAHGCRFKLGDAVLKVRAAIAAKIGGSRRPMCHRAA